MEPEATAGAVDARPARKETGFRRPFPSLIIRRDGFEPKGSFAEAQAEYLEPDPDTVKELRDLLQATGMGIVAHFYMDAELQGVLAACDWPHIHVADSLMMADRAVKMSQAGAEGIVVLGVDFMSENVRATLDASGAQDVPVYRVAQDPIGCSLAESAEAPAYGAYLEKASKTPNSLHVIYVNTSLRVKAHAHAKVPTITCTSSNVVPMVLQAFAQVPDLHVWFGPDTYMGHNLYQLLSTLPELEPEALKSLHADHGPESIRDALSRFHYFEQGVCVVHHMFGDQVVSQVRAQHPDAYVTAHLEVPGEMFTLGLDAQRKGRGVVGSTSNILGFIADKTRAHAKDPAGAPLQFVLGTESGMTTPIARQVQQILREADSDVAVEIVFPVAQEAVSPTEDKQLAVVPGVPVGEGCSVAGGCATCPYMKMNSMDALLDVLQRIQKGEKDALAPFAPKTYDERIDGRTVSELGTHSIVHMREFQKNGALPQDLVEDVQSR